MKTKKQSYKDGHSTININEVSKPININGEVIEPKGDTTESKQDLQDCFKCGEVINYSEDPTYCPHCLVNL